MFLIFHLARADIRPVGDYGLHRAVQLAFGTRELPEPAAVARRAERWTPFRTVASGYLCRAAEQPP